MRRRLATLLSLLVVLAATLGPAAEQHTAYRLFATHWLADAVLNILLFMPLGAALAAGRRPVRRLVLLTAGLAGAIELTQALIPGRDPSPVDLVTNTLGAALGAVLWRSAPWWSRPSRAAAGALGLAAATTTALVMLGTGVLLAPSLPHAEYYGQWTPSLGHLEWYRGRVLTASLGGEPLPGRRLTDTEHVRRLLLRGAEVDVRAIAGPPTSRLGSLVSIYDHLQREIVLLGPDGDDMAFRMRARAVAIGLNQPAERWRGVLRGVRRGDTLAVRVRPGPDGRCLFVNGREACAARYRAGSGWSLLRRVDGLSPRGESLLGALWLALLVAPTGFWIRRSTAGTGAALVLTAAAWSAPLAGLAGLAWWEGAGMALGLAGGAALAWVVRRAGWGSTTPAT